MRSVEGFARLSVRRWETRPPPPPRRAPPSVPALHGAVDLRVRRSPAPSADRRGACRGNRRAPGLSSAPISRSRLAPPTPGRGAGDVGRGGCRATSLRRRAGLYRRGPAVSLFRLRGFDRLASGLPPVGWKDPLHLLASQTPTCTGSLVRRGVWAPTWGPSLARRDLSRPSFADPQTAQKADSRLSGAPVTPEVAGSSPVAPALRSARATCRLLPDGSLVLPTSVWVALVPKWCPFPLAQQLIVRARGE